LFYSVFWSGFKNTVADKLDWAGWLARQRLGLRQPCRNPKPRGTFHARWQKHCHSFIETALLRLA